MTDISMVVVATENMTYHSLVLIYKLGTAAFGYIYSYKKTILVY